MSLGYCLEYEALYTILYLPATSCPAKHGGRAVAMFNNQLGRHLEMAGKPFGISATAVSKVITIASKRVGWSDQERPR